MKTVTEIKKEIREINYEISDILYRIHAIKYEEQQEAFFEYDQFFKKNIEGRMKEILIQHKNLIGLDK